MKESNTSKRLKELMNIYGLKQADICRRTGINTSTMSQYIKGIREPQQNILTLIADSFGISEVWLMGYDVPMKDEKRQQVEVEQKPKATVKQKITKSETSVDALGDAMDYVVLGKAIGENIDVVVSLSKLNKDNQDKVRRYLKLLISQQDMEEDV